MSLLKLFKTEVLDKYIRENFQRLEDRANVDVFDLGRFKFLTYAVGSASTAELQHNLGFQPKDVIALSVSPDNTTVTWNTDDFTRTTLSVTVSAACTVRALVGRYGDT